MTPCRSAGGEFSRDEPAPDFFERVLLFRVQNVRGRREIGVPGIFVGRERLFPDEQAALFFEAQDGARETPAFAMSRSRGIGPRVAARTSRIFSSAGAWQSVAVALRASRIPGDDFLRARFAVAHHFPRGKIAAANELFGGAAPPEYGDGS